MSRTFPLGPYLAAARAALPNLTPSRIRHELLDWNADTWRTANTIGIDLWRVEEYRADELASKLETHPALIWPEWFDHAQLELFEDA